jgi:hypothetical protein
MMLSKIFSLGLLAGAAVGIAVPAPVEHLEKRAIATTLYNTFVLYDQYVAAAYCPANSNGVNKVVTCTQNYCPEINPLNSAIVAYVQ